MKHCFLIVLVAILLSSCDMKSEYIGFTRSGGDLHYHLVVLGDEAKQVNNSAYLSFSVTFKTLKDSLVAIKHFRQIRLENIDTSSVLPKALLMCQEGDSIHFIATAGRWDFQALNMSVGIPDSIPVIAEVSVKKVLSGTEWVAWKREKARLRDLELKEQVSLQKVLDSLGLDRDSHQDNTYIKILNPGNGEAPSYGDNVVADYKAMFCDGREFDNTYRGNSLEFMMGKPDQVLPGFATGISKMKEGGKAVFVVPSVAGFGERGSTSGIVPPFTTLIYEVELKEVRKS